MKRKFPSFLARRAFVAGSVFAPLLVTFLFVGTCGGGKSGFVLAFKAGKVVVTAGWCAAETPPKGT